MVFGLATTLVVLIVALLIFGASIGNWLLLSLGMVFSAAAFSAPGILVSVSVKAVLEAQTLANFALVLLFCAARVLARRVS